MSVNNQPPSADPTISQRANRTTGLEDLDKQLQQLSDTVLSHHPYLLTLPTNLPYRLSTAQHTAAVNWAVGHDRPFQSGEQPLQFTTFLTFNKKSLLKAVGDWCNKSGERMVNSVVPSRRDTPREVAAKQKISLSDYRNHRNQNTIKSVESQNKMKHSVNLKREEQKQTPKLDPVKKSDKLTLPFSSKSQSLLPPSKASKKRPSTTDTEHLGPSATKSPDMHSPKKSRLSPEKETRSEMIPAQSHSPRLPALLSPTLPPTSGPKLPRLLSPTLPPDIEKELARLEERSSRNSPKRDTASVKGKRDDPIQNRTPKSSNSSSISSHQSTRTGLPSKNNGVSKYMVKLRYGKANRKRIEGLLKFSGNKKPARADSPLPPDTDLEDMSNNDKNKMESAPTRNHAPDRVKPKDKPEADETFGALGGRPKESKGSIEKPPTAAHLSSSLLHTHEKVKSTSLTPVKDTKGLNSRRNGGDSTPKNSAIKQYSTDLGTKALPLQSDSRSRDQDRRAWRDEYQKVYNVARELKHAAERYTSKSGASNADKKLAAVTAIEAIMCFILAFVADDQSKVLARQASDSSLWRSILAYWRVVQKNSSTYPVLNSLCLLLGAVSYSTIHALDLERLAVSPLPGEHTPVPTPGSDGNTVPSDENKKSRKDFLELKNRLPGYYKESQKLWLEVSRGLSEDVLSEEFPTTWSRRSHNHSERGKSTLRAGDYAGDYFLPLGGTSPPIEVVRFGWSLLKEWCSQEKVEWNGRLGL
ncbi:hypothetical protein N7495_008905 [Penicillium taxi]|uniref:uncharacterized protein n=1 Tax=Penicillium taxi TaxID=168475 RepID=UPI00254574CB|nr:uncharacterized protein N7495_008905 [Penicillium taxi]KAJ5888864.1 hypothetical protein N7495_008905 [Penicillium taxi]